MHALYKAPDERKNYYQHNYLSEQSPAHIHLPKCLAHIFARALFITYLARQGVSYVTSFIVILYVNPVKLSMPKFPFYLTFFLPGNHIENVVMILFEHKGLVSRCQNIPAPRLPGFRVIKIKGIIVVG